MSATMIATQAPARALETALGDPFDPGAPISFRELMAYDEREASPTGAFDILREAGAYAYLVPEAFGGRLTSFAELFQLVRVLSRRDLVLTTGLGSTMLAAIPVWAWGDDDQRRAVAHLLLDQGAFGSFAVSERQAGSDFQATMTRADVVDGRYRVHGEKWLIGNASRSAFVVALVRTQPALSLLFFLPDQLGDANFRRLPRIKTLGLRGHDMGGMAFDECPMPLTALLGRAGRGAEMALTTLQYTRTMIGAMALGAADTALRLGIGWARERRLYGDSIIAIPAVRALLLRAFVDILIAECVTLVTARALTIAPRRTTLWAAVTKYLVPNFCEGVVRDASIVLSARSYLREGIAEGIFQKIARDIAITSIFEGTQLVQLSLIGSQLDRLRHAGSRDGETADLEWLCDLRTEAPAWDPPSTRLRIADPGGDELVERWFGSGVPAEALPPRLSSEAMALLRVVAHGLFSARPGAVAQDLAAARRYCVLFAAACCLQVWRTNRTAPGPIGADDEWVRLCLERLAGGTDWNPGHADLHGSAFSWMLGQHERGELFSVTPFELAR